MTLQDTYNENKTIEQLEMEEDLRTLLQYMTNAEANHFCESGHENGHILNLIRSVDRRMQLGINFSIHHCGADDCPLNK